MENRDLKLVLNVIDYLIADEKSNGHSLDLPKGRNVADILLGINPNKRNGAIQQKAIQPLERANTNEIMQLKNEVAALKQRLQTEQQRAETAEKQWQHLKDNLKSAEAIATATNELFAFSAGRLEHYFPESFCAARPEATQNGNVFFVTEKFGITYLVMLASNLNGLEGANFALASRFALQQIIHTQRYLNPAKLIEEFEHFVAGIAPTQTFKMSVCLMDKQNLEVEFADNGLPFYSLSHRHWQNHESKKISKAVFKKGIQLYFCSTNLTQAAHLRDLLASGSDEEKQQELLQYAPKEQDFLLIGIKL